MKNCGAAWIAKMLERGLPATERIVCCVGKNCSSPSRADRVKPGHGSFSFGQDEQDFQEVYESYDNLTNLHFEFPASPAATAGISHFKQIFETNE